MTTIVDQKTQENLETRQADGILNLLKPPHVTSRDVVDDVCKVVGTRQVGHAGTLDPLATGVLLGTGQDYTVAILVAGACPLVAVAALIFLVRSGRTPDRDSGRSSMQTSWEVWWA